LILSVSSAIKREAKEGRAPLGFDYAFGRGIKNITGTTN
jgi:hypothetical protein